MRKHDSMLVFGALLAAFGASTVWAGGKTEICHFPPGNPANFHTLTVGSNAVSSHLDNHNDLLGSCQANCEAICSDNNACTIDVVANPDECICAAEPRAQVDCSDGNFCTADSCNAETGSCTNDPGPLNGNVCDDDNANTSGETCSNGACEPPCPCFTGADLDAQGAILACGSNFPGFPNLTGVRWANGGAACSGTLCASPSLTDATCLMFPPGTVSDVTAQEDANCRALILLHCPNPNLTRALTSEETSGAAFGDL